ncbi:hypothetical protein F2Q69_00061269 [Brassica cretica]|uniref:Uncharacterized protein n=1 Tax=Brassica cretica TaxID=69181 RepID=A0A8S9RD31_BRACR|nr:hypothetical protein F2Q69_00061269 [Brassica cretica]
MEVGWMRTGSETGMQVRQGVIQNGMGTATWRSGKSPAYFKRGDYVLVLKVGALALKQACKFTKELSKVIAYVYESCSICIRSYKH